MAGRLRIDNIFCSFGVVQLSRLFAFFFFFFSSRRRHTRFDCDWSSDVCSSDLSGPTAEEYWPDMAGLDYRDTVTDFEMPAGTFFDIGVVHLLTTATIDQLRALYPQGRIETRRFRPNIIVATGPEDRGFVENDWIGHTVAIGGSVRLAITEPCPRCVMITLPQGDLPKDSGILRTAAQHNAVNVGVYASVLSGGTIRRGDPVTLA